MWYTLDTCIFKNYKIDDSKAANQYGSFSLKTHSRCTYEDKNNTLVSRASGVFQKQDAAEVWITVLLWNMKEKIYGFFFFFKAKQAL